MRVALIYSGFETESTTTCSNMAYLGYGNVPTYVDEYQPPVVVTGPYDDPYYVNSSTFHSFGHTSTPMPHAPPPEPTGSPWEVGVNSSVTPSTGFFSPEYESGSVSQQSRQSLHVVTNPSVSYNHVWSGATGGGFVQSPISYCSPSPNPHGVPSIGRCKIVDIKLDEGHYVRIDLTRCLDGRELRKAIISRLLDMDDPPTSSFDLFRDYPPGPGSDVAIDDQQLMLDLEHFGDAKGSLKLSVRGAHVESTSDSHLPSYARMPTATLSPIPSHSPYPYPCLARPSPSSPSKPRDSTFDYYGPGAPTLTNRSQSSNSYLTNPSSYASVPMPMPIPMPMPDNGHGYRAAPGFPVPSHYPASNPASVSSTPIGPAFRDFPRQSSYTGPPKSPITSNNAPINDQLGQVLDGFGNMSIGRNDAQMQTGYNRHSNFSQGSGRDSVVISGTMTTEEILSHLYARGCQNLTGELDESTFSRDPVASGGAGDVYSGMLYTGERVGIKCIRMANMDMYDEERSKLKKTAHELYVWSKCKHQNVLELIGVTQYRNRIAMVSPWMDNGDLRSFLRSHPDTDRYDLCTQMADGVAYLHALNIVHGDIKGAPEIIEEKSSNSYPADVYALGMTILEAMTGSIPYAEVSNDVIVMKKITQGILPLRPEAHIPPSCYRASFLWSLMNRCWNYDPQIRPTAAQIQEQVWTIKS
ncbi:unnamed protein product [Rhizoctonia solani]|uniref:Protein kinase domain-containing protein n=1 Tax=Rhizoctonia solani TaxID=456999 RepID=A0A8H3GAS9_9AGAM|nr:unnamed protein product [Rhizoctonia solani]